MSNPPHGDRCDAEDCSSPPSAPRPSRREQTEHLDCGSGLTGRTGAAPVDCLPIDRPSI